MPRLFYNLSTTGLLLLAGALFLTSCSTKVTGGRQERAKHGIYLQIEPAGGGSYTVQDDGERLSTTQPSASTNTGRLPKFGSADEGQIGSVSFEQAKANFPNAWPLALLFIAVAAGLWFLAGARLAAIAVAGCAVLTLLFPQAMIFGAILAVGLFIWSVRGRLKDLVSGNQNALASLNPDDAKQAKVLMEAKHDVATKRVVATLKT